MSDHQCRTANSIGQTKRADLLAQRRSVTRLGMTQIGHNTQVCKAYVETSPQKEASEASCCCGHSYIVSLVSGSHVQAPF